MTAPGFDCMPWIFINFNFRRNEMVKKETMLDISANKVLDVTPRKIGRLVWSASKRAYHIVRGTENKELRARVAQLEAKQT